MTLPYLAGSKWRHMISGYPNRGGTLAVAARGKEVGQALGPQRLRPASHSGLRRAPRPAEPQRDLASVFGRTLTVFGIWPSPGNTRGHRIFAPSGTVLDSWDSGHSGHESAHGLAWSAPVAGLPFKSSGPQGDDNHPHHMQASEKFRVLIFC